MSRAASAPGERRGARSSRRPSVREKRRRSRPPARGDAVATEALPTRPLHLRVPSQGEPWNASIVALLAVAVIGCLLYFLGPDLLRDWRIREASVPATEVLSASGRCRSRFF